MQPSEVEQVFQYWQQRQLCPARCLLSPVREKRLQKLLKTYTVAELLLVIRWVYESDDDRAVYLRVQGYTDVLEIFRFDKVDARLEMAQAWNDLQPDQAPVQAPLLGSPRRAK